MGCNLADLTKTFAMAAAYGVWRDAGQQSGDERA